MAREKKCGRRMRVTSRRKRNFVQLMIYLKTFFLISYFNKTWPIFNLLSATFLVKFTKVYRIFFREISGKKYMVGSRHFIPTPFLDQIKLVKLVDMDIILVWINLKMITGFIYFDKLIVKQFSRELGVKHLVRSNDKRNIDIFVFIYHDQRK